MLFRAAKSALPVLVLALTLSAAAHGADYFVRPDGGDAAQCSGKVDLPAVPGQTDCAWRHPFDALPPGGPARIAGGDTLFLRPGSYRMGFGAPQTARCAAEFPWDCHMPPIPSGASPHQPTRILGSDGDGRCERRPELWGTERAARVLNLDGSRDVEVACLEITDHESCVENHCHGGECERVDRCERDRFPFGDWAGTGIFARDSSNVRLRDLDVHGMALRGVHAGRLSDWTLERVAIVGNGWSGWDGDLGDGDSGNSGALVFVDVEIAWNGCAEAHPQRTAFGCWGQSSGGYGDGLGTGASGGRWTFDQVRVHHNASDGLDLLYLLASASVSVTRSQLHSNGGNQLKASGDAEVRDSTIAGNCAALSAHGLRDGDLCRAGGNAVVFALQPGKQAQLVRNRLSGEGDCLLVAERGDENSSVLIRGNSFDGAPMWNRSGKQACGFYAHQSPARIEGDGNRFRGVRSGDCAVGNLCSDGK